MFYLCLIPGCAKQETTTGFWQEMHTATAINTGSPRSGRQVYEYKCSACHDKNTQGAPMPGDNYEWSARYQKGLDVLINHTLDGFNQGLMPSRGGCKDCNEQELTNAIIYMLKTSGIEIVER
jgi:cytochrome c5